MAGTERGPSRRAPWHGAARLAVLLVALGGLFAMHGLADHGAARHGSMQGMSAPVAALVDHHGQHAGSHVDRPTSGPESASTQVITDDGHGGHGMAELCLAVLTALLLLVVGTALLCGRPVLAALLAPPARAVAWVRARAPDPPDLHLLCVQRC